MAVGAEFAGEHFRLWLRAGMTGCRFAQLLGGKAGRVAIDLHVGAELPEVGWLSNAFDEHAKAGRAVIAVLPQLLSESALVAFLNALVADPRWRTKRHARTSPAGGVLVGLEWTTSTGEVSDTMGFAPFAIMPVPRRAPYVAIATWPGGYANPFRGQPPTPPARAGVVSFLDAAHDFDEPLYGKLWTETGERVSALMALPPDDARLYRRAAFVLSPEHAEQLATA